MTKYYRLSSEDAEYRDLVDDIIIKIDDKYRIFRKRFIISIALIMLSFLIFLIPISIVHRILVFLNIFLVGIAVLVTALYMGVKIVSLRRIYYPIVGIPIPHSKNNMILYDVLGNANVISLKTVSEQYLGNVNDIRNDIEGLANTVADVFSGKLDVNETRYIIVKDENDTKTVLTKFEDDIQKKLSNITKRLNEPEVKEVKIVVIKPYIKKLVLESLKQIILDDKFSKEAVTVSNDDINDVKNKIESVFSLLDKSTKLLGEINKHSSLIANCFSNYYSWVNNLAVCFPRLMAHLSEVFVGHVCPVCLVSRTEYGVHDYPWIILEDYVNGKYVGKCCVCEHKYSVDETINTPKIMRLFISSWRKLYKLEVEPKLNSVIEYVDSKNNYLVNQAISTVNYFCLNEERHIYREYGKRIEPVLLSVIKDCIESLNIEYVDKIKKINKIKIPLEYLGTWIIEDKLHACEKHKNDICWYYPLFKKAIDEGDFALVKKIIEEISGENKKLLSKVVEKQVVVERKDSCQRISEMEIDYSTKRNIINRINKLKKHLEKIINNIAETIDTINKDVVDDLKTDLSWFTRYSKWVNRIKDSCKQINIMGNFSVNHQIIIARDLITELTNELQERSNAIMKYIESLKDYDDKVLSDFSLETSVPLGEPLVFYVPVYRVVILTNIRRGKAGEIREITKVFSEVSSNKTDKLADEELIKNYVDKLFNETTEQCIDEDVVKEILSVVESTSGYGLLYRIFFKWVLLRNYGKILCK
ncbi:hypothetical protein J4526_09275 [Desulfurococcaceae archaeon MEX13E-LK6-19]|nr:hypothetical protein J4526_09275 [Desulfurococcaceae archaeon MEX13E-LK6-19]